MESLRLFPDTEYKGAKDLSNRPHGVGCLKDSSNGVEYVGELTRGFADGHGILKTSEGECFAGEFSNGSIDGYGVHNTADGITVTGRFKNGNCLTVQGQVIFDDQSYGLPYHEGTLTEKDGIKEIKKRPRDVAAGIEHAKIASEIVDRYLGIHVDEDVVRTTEVVSEESTDNHQSGEDAEHVVETELNTETDTIMNQMELIFPANEDYGSRVCLLDDAASSSNDNNSKTNAAFENEQAVEQF